jgi:hypothetical protein
MKAGRQISAATYTKGRWGLLAHVLTEHLREGATLIVNSIDQMHEPATRLAEHLERVFEARVAINLYSAWKTVHGFDAHADDHDVIILQIAGRKLWKVYGQSRPREISSSSGDSLETHAEWEALLEDGDALYIPKGWWHAAVPCNEPCLHLTVAIYGATGAELLQWAAHELMTTAVVQAKIPCSEDDEVDSEFARTLGHAVSHFLNQPGALRRFRRFRRETADLRPTFALPWTATDSGLPPSDDWKIRLTGPWELYLECGPDESVSIRQGGEQSTFDEKTVPLFEFLAANPTSAIKAFYNTFDDLFEKEDLKSFLAALVARGLAIPTSE